MRTHLNHPFEAEAPVSQIGGGYGFPRPMPIQMQQRFNQFPVIGAVLPQQNMPLAAPASLLMLKLPYPGSDPTEMLYNNGYVQGAQDGAIRGLAAGALVGGLLVFAFAGKKKLF